MQIDPEQLPVLEMDELWSFVFCGENKVWAWIAMNRTTREVVAYACGDRSENTCRILWDRVPSDYKKPLFLAIIGKRIKLSFRASNIARWVKKREKRPILSVGIIPYGNIWLVSYVRHYLFPNAVKCMRFV